jgi:hypothetical protein
MGYNFYSYLKLLQDFMRIFMVTTNYISKHEFVQHTGKYLKLCEKEGVVIITQHEHPALRLTLIRKKTTRDLRGLLKGMKIVGDINVSVFPELDKW